MVEDQHRQVHALLQGQRDLATVGRLLLSELPPLVNAQQGVIYQMETEGTPILKLLAAYADSSNGGHPATLTLGAGLVGQCALEKRRLLISEMPDDAIPIGSVLFAARPRNVVVLPVLFENQVKAVIELATLNVFTPLQITFLEHQYRHPP